jgi:hypothetical protein
MHIRTSDSCRYRNPYIGDIKMQLAAFPEMHIPLAVLLTSPRAFFIEFFERNS